MTHSVKKWTTGETEVLIKRDDHARTNDGCQKKVSKKLKAKVQTDEEIDRLHKAVEKHGRDWKAVAEVVGNQRTNEECRRKFVREVKAGRMTELEGKFKSKFWTDEESDRLYKAVEK